MGSQERETRDAIYGREVITRGLVAPRKVLDAMEEASAERGLLETLVRQGALSRDTAEAVRRVARSARTSPSSAPTEERRIPTLKLDDTCWRTAESSRPRFLLAACEQKKNKKNARKVTRTPPAPPQLGSKLGPWLLEDLIGRGGMGLVFKARHVENGRLAAVKVVNDPTRGARSERFAREVATVRRLRHPNIVRLLASDLEARHPYFAMELVEGTTLRALIRSGKTGMLRRSVEILRDVAKAVDHAHSQGVLHRDLKPSNVLIAADGTVKITDFGLAKVDDGRNPTRASTPVGTPAYMAPEQALCGKVGRRADVFSVGVMLYEVIEGELPWTDGRLATLYLGEEVPLPPMLHADQDLAAIVARATRTQQRERFSSAAELARELDGWLEAHPAPGPVNARRAVQGIAAGVATLVFALGVGHVLTASEPAPKARPVAVAAVSAPAPGRVAAEPVVVAPVVVTPVVVASVAAPVAAAEPVAVKDPAPAPAPVVAAVAAPVAPVVVRRPVPAALREPEVEGPSEKLVNELAARIRSEVDVMPIACAESFDISPRLPSDRAGAELARALEGRSALAKAVAALPGLESFEDKSLTCVMKDKGRVPLSSFGVRDLAAAIPDAQARSNVGLYLRGRGLVSLGYALDR